ncbi:ABC transporter permease [Derxia gummosa]|uniref:ABC transporter permease n=1 Tax=Derxia gummosa DSM 723 TaxID=1121388 RepID=A0A8B6X324_9BURK|nr:ABC transporter permease [Derxia gummosa]
MASHTLPDYATPVQRLSHWALLALAGVLLVFLMLPILVIVPLSFNADSILMYPMTGFSLRWYEELAQSAPWRQALMNTAIVTPASTLLAVALGTLAAVGLSRGEFAGKALLTAILVSPMVVPAVIVGVAVYLLFAPLGLAGSYTGLILAHAVLGVPFVIITVTATLQGFDHNLMRAASSLGAPPLTAFFKVMLPVVAPGVASGALFAFATSLDEVVVTLFLAAPSQATLPRQMFAGIRENISPTIAAVATLLIVLSASALVVVEYLRRRAERIRTAKVD